MRLLFLFRFVPRSDSFCVLGSLAAQACPQGLFSGPGQAVCTSSCTGGRYSDPLSAQEKCLPCSAGYACAGGGASPVPCPAGTYCIDMTVNPVSCEAGTYNPASVVSACQSCPSGAFCPLGSLSPTQCPVGKYNPEIGKANESTACLLCVTPGVYCGLGSSGDANGVKCPAGSYCASPRKLAPCPASTWRKHRV
jgi:hypothetical protein